MEEETYVVVAFPVVEFSEMRRYFAPTKNAFGYESLEEAQASANEANLVCNGVGFTYEAMSLSEFNKLEWPSIELTY